MFLSKMKSMGLAGAIACVGVEARADEPSERGFVKLRSDELYKVFGLRHVLRLGPELEPLEADPFELTNPLISNDGSLAFVVTRDGRLHAHWIDSGKELWSRYSGRSGRALGQHKDQLYVGRGTQLVSLEAFSGRELWSVELNGMVGGRIVTTGTVAFVPVRPAGLVSVDLTSKEVRWRAKRARPEGITMMGQSAPTYDRARDLLYVGFPDGSIQAIAASNGESRWTAQLGGPRQPFRDVDASPVLGPDGVLVAASYDAGVFGVDPDDGRILWKEESVKGVTGLSVVSGRVIATDGGAVGFGSQGQVVWRYKPTKGFLSEPTGFGFGLVGFASSSGAIPVLDATTGKPVQIIDPGPSGVLTAPAVRAKDVMVLSNRGTLLMLRYGSGTSITR